MATEFATPDEAKAKYNEIANTLLSGDATGTKYGHNQVRLNDEGKFETFDLRYKGGDPSALVAQGNNVADALNRAVDTYGLDTSGIKKGVGLGSVRYDPGAGVKTDAATLFNNIFGANFQGQYDAKLAGIQPPAPPPAPPPPPPEPPPPMQYGQPAPPPAPPPAAPQPIPEMAPNPNAGQGLASLAPPPPSVPNFGTAPNATPDGAPGFQAPATALNNLPRGPVIGGQYAHATASGDPFMSYTPTQYRAPLTGDQAYEQMGLKLLSRYAQGADAKEHNYFPNRSTFEAGPAPNKYGYEDNTSKTEVGKGVRDIYNFMAS